MYASSWFLTLFLTTFPLPVATRVFDIFMYEVRVTRGAARTACSAPHPRLTAPPLQGLEIVFRVGLALLQVNQAELMQLDMEGMSQVGQGQEGPCRAVRASSLALGVILAPAPWPGEG